MIVPYKRNGDNTAFPANYKKLLSKNKIGPFFAIHKLENDLEHSGIYQ